MTTTLYLARHGQPEGGTILRGRRDDRLSGLGVIQAYRLGRYLAALFGADLAIGAAFSSPLRRARETAEIALLGTGKRPTLVDGLMEVDWGDLTGVSLHEARRRREPTIEAWRSGGDFCPPGGESRNTLEARVLSAMSEIVTQQLTSALIVTHGGPIQVMLGALLGADFPDRPDCAVPEASLSAIEIGSDGATLLFLGDTSHLSGLEVIA